MAPKKKQDDGADRPPEGDDERLLTIALAISLNRGVLQRNKSPMFAVMLSSAPEDLHRLEIPSDVVASCSDENSNESVALQLTLLSKKVTITPQFVDNVLGGRIVVGLFCIPEAKEVVQVAVKGAKAPAPAKGAKNPSSVLDMPIDDLSQLITFSFDLCTVFEKVEWSADVFDLAPLSNLLGVTSGTLKVTSNDPLLAPSNVAKYMPVVVEVTRVTNLPHDGPLPIEHNGLRSSTLSKKQCDQGNVYVDYTFLGEYVSTPPLPRAPDVEFSFRKAFFLSRYSRMDLFYKLFVPCEFNVHDQEHHQSKLRPSFGRATVSVRTAITEQVKRFVNSSQLLPAQDGNDGALPPPDYLSFGTTLKTRIEFLVSPERPVYAPSTGGEGVGESLSRVLLTMPYVSSTVPATLQAIMGTLVSMPKGGVDSGVKEAVSTSTETNKKGPAVPTPPGTKAFRLMVPPGVSGFEVIDDERRLLCFEGPITAVHQLAEVATSVIGDDPQCSVLINAELQFPQRAYHCWPSLVLPMEEQKPKEVTAPTPDARPAGKKAAAPPPKKKMQEVEVIKAPSPEMEDAPPEIDAGGVGGRIRRIRLGTLLSKLSATQRNFLKRTLPLDALTCVTKLTFLRQARSVLHAVDMNLFPSAKELIALERIHGETLELVDVCGTNEFVSFSDADVSHIVRKAQASSNVTIPKQREVNVTDLKPEDVGLVVSFVGVPASEQQRAGLSFNSPTYDRFKHKAIVFVLSNNQAVRCAFSADPPTQMLRHAFTAQIVESSGCPVLFVIDCQSLAKISSDHINHKFDEKIRKDKRRAPAHEYFSQLAARKHHYNSVHSKSNRQYRDTSSDDEDGFVDGPPSVAHGLEQPELIPNYVVLNKSIPAGTSLVEEIPDYGLARELYEKQGRRMQREASELNSTLGQAPFRTVMTKTGEESRKHPQAPSQQRIDDLHQPWEAPRGYKGTKTGPNPLRYNGRSALEDPERGKSLLSGLTAQDKRQQEAEETSGALERWRSKVVVEDTSFHVRCRMPTDVPVSQLDKLQPMLDGQPSKHSLKKTFAAPAPPSIFSHEMRQPNHRVDPKVRKHPDIGQFYYPKESILPKKLNDISAAERQSPLYYPPLQ